MTVRVSCPFCNTGFTLPAPPPGGRATCPRCGDAFPVRAQTDDESPVDEGPTPASPVAAPAASIPTRSGSRNMVVALIVGVVVVGLGIWLVLHFRQGTPLPPAPPPSSGVAPLELAGLSYLPPDSSIVLAVRLGPILAHAEKTGQGPQAVLTGAGVPAPVLATLDRLGVPLGEIDHLAAGVRVPNADLTELRFAFALVLRKPLPEEERFLTQLKARREVKEGKVRYAVEFASFPMTMVRVSGTVWVFGREDADLAPAESGGTATLSANLRETIGEQVPADAAAWVATDTTRWADKTPVRALVTTFGTKEWLAVLEQGRAAAAGLTVGESSRLRVFIRCSDPAAGDKLRAYFRAKVTSEGTQHGGTGDTATLDTPASPQTVAATIKRLLEDAGK